MENYNEFSPIEQAAMEQSPAHETNVGHNSIEACSFIDCVEEAVKDIGHVVEVTAKVAKVVTADTVEVTPGVAEAGGVVIDGVFTKKHIELLKSVNQECSVEELIDLRSSLIKANRM